VKDTRNKEDVNAEKPQTGEGNLEVNRRGWPREGEEPIVECNSKKTEDGDACLKREQIV